ncbi:tRNA (adenosine(37)-N6)-threonylcarbamoyltransferase complex dimerization subunit type 1 TsaB [Georgenia faecalis]|uniref:tRNA (Adenosine(37)-N6)-threonylcarbamoyltransferase complex dimerization subunit type 1 TsaB n=1 Tax=Georgenia faecalis TaxID=2483799 RepID=A0ABV9D722_9MICO|nr:tRNA (adenosine(37)-N6)-threonylcarbamoyltransferase complex dimerization subunit type 1 TsaB [Georgenia faecalis]
MRILCIDTSAGSAVALTSGREVLARAASADERRHAETLSPMIEAVLSEAGLAPGDLDALAVGTGPAPFTGLRVGLVTARTLARALGVPVHGVPSLDVLARQVLDAAPDREVLVATDARRREVYWARYRAAGPDDVERLDGFEVAPAAQVAASPATAGDVVLAGRGTVLYPDALPATAGVPGEVDPAVLARLATARVARGAELGTEPLYLRRPDVTPAAGRKRAT